jgi:hypothetical protein
LKSVEALLLSDEGSDGWGYHGSSRKYMWKRKETLEEEGTKMGGREYVFPPPAGLSLNLSASGIIELLVIYFSY